MVGVDGQLGELRLRQVGFLRARITAEGLATPQDVQGELVGVDSQLVELRLLVFEISFTTHFIPHGHSI